MPSARTLMRSLRSVALLAALPDERLAALEIRCRWHHSEAGQLLINHRDPSTDVYFLTAGRVRAVIYSASGKAVAFRDHSPGDMFDELAAIDGRSRSASVEALEPCTMASMDAVVFRKLLEAEPAVAWEFGHLASVGVIARKGKALVITDVERLSWMVSEASGE